MILSSLAFIIFSGHLTQGCRNGSRDVGDCLHVYLERDFLSIEAIVYPKKNSLGASEEEKHLLLDGPELQGHCRQISEVVLCLEFLQPTCYYNAEFFPYRHLVTSLRKSVDWVCADLRGRFRTLLSAFNCMESARLIASQSPTSPCYDPQIPGNIWQRIIRLESSTEVCGSLASHLHCVQEKKYFKNCRKDAETVYQELSRLFLNNWCAANSGNWLSINLNMYTALVLIVFNILS